MFGAAHFLLIFQLREFFARSRKYCTVVTINTFIYRNNVQSIEFSSVFHLFEFLSLNNSRTSDLHSFIFLLLFLQIFAIALNLSRCCCLRASYFLRSAFFIRYSRNLQRIFSERPVLRRSNSSSILLQLITFSKCLPKLCEYKDLYSKLLLNNYRLPNSPLPHSY